MTQNNTRYKPHGGFLEQPKFRPEVQGLRSLAVLLVVMYHVWFGRVSGGVDVFLFISAFLLSLSSLRKIQDGKPLKVVSYWLHVFQRLLPAAATVIAATLVAAYFIIAPSRWASLLADAKAALFYFLNWRLAFNSVDYYAQDATLKTPFQHFWSLSMQGQIFIIWPLLFAFVAFLVGYLRLKVLPTALFVFGTVFVTSLTFSVIETSTNQSFAYFDTRTRLWEFAAGTLLAMLVLAWRVPFWLKVPLGWLGVIGLVTCGWLLPVEQAFPGYLALWPLLSGAFVIAAGQTGSRFGVDRLLSAKPLQKMGAISYCLYLVHWPILILYTTAIGEPKAGWIDGTLVILSSIAAAWILHNVVEKPLRAWEKKPSRRALRHLMHSKAPWSGNHQKPQNSWVRPASVIGAVLLLTGGATAGAQVWLNSKVTQWQADAALAGTARFPGALAAGTSQTYSDPAIPMYLDENHWEVLDHSCSTYPGLEYSQIETMDEDSFCSYSLTGGSYNAPILVVAGDSHANFSTPIYQELATSYGMNLMAVFRPGCRLSVPDQSWATGDPAQTPSCKEFNSRVLDAMEIIEPEYVALISTRTWVNSSGEVPVEGLNALAHRFENQGTKVIALRDNPRFLNDMFTCAEAVSSTCASPVKEHLADTNPALAELKELTNVYQVDLTNAYCPEGLCQAVIGNVKVYLDNNHITKQFAVTTTSLVEDQLLAQGWNPAR